MHLNNVKETLRNMKTPNRYKTKIYWQFQEIFNKIVNIIFISTFAAHYWCFMCCLHISTTQLTNFPQDAKQDCVVKLFDIWSLSLPTHSELIMRCMSRLRLLTSWSYFFIADNLENYQAEHHYGTLAMQLRCEPSRIIINIYSDKMLLHSVRVRLSVGKIFTRNLSVIKTNGTV